MIGVIGMGAIGSRASSWGAVLLVLVEVSLVSVEVSLVSVEVSLVSAEVALVGFSTLAV